MSLDNVRMSAQAQTVHNFPRAEPREDVNPLPQVSLPQRIKSLFTWEDLVVAGRAVKGFVVSPGIAAVVLAFILGLGGTIYWRLSDQIQNQRDLIVEMRTTLREKSEQEKEYRLEVKQTLATQKVYFDSLSNQVYTVKGLLSPEQSKRLDQATKPQ